MGPHASCGIHKEKSSLVFLIGQINFACADAGFVLFNAAITAHSNF